MLVFQKLLVQLAQPVGLLWLVLLLITVRCWRKRETGTAGLLAGTWIFYTLAGNPIVGDALIATLENRYAQVTPLEAAPFDTVIVLGGGTGTTPSNTAQLADAGDRVALAARLYHAGKVRRIVVTGKQIESLSIGQQADPARQAEDLLTKLGVPADRIAMLGGRNTLEEMRTLRETLDQSKRIGLITSAWHLARAMRLAEQADLEVEPLPADFATGPTRRSVLDVVPDHDALRNSDRVVKEYLAALVGR